MDGFYRGLCHVLLFARPQPVVKRPSRCCRCTSTMPLPRKKNMAKKVIQTIRAIMISQDIDKVAGDFNGNAWRCRSRDNLSTIDEMFSDCALPTPPSPHTIVGTRIHPRQLGRRMWFPQAPRLSTILESEQTRCFFVKLLVYDPMIKVATLRHGFTCISLIGTTSGIIMLMMMGTFASKNGLRVLEMELKNVISAMC